MGKATVKTGKESNLTQGKHLNRCFPFIRFKPLNETGIVKMATRKAPKADVRTDAEKQRAAERIAEDKRRFPHTSMEARYINSTVHFILVGHDTVRFRDSEFFAGYHTRFGGMPIPVFVKPNNDEGIRAVVYFELEEAHKAMTELLEWYKSRDAIGHGFKKPAGLCISR